MKVHTTARWSVRLAPALAASILCMTAGQAAASVFVIPPPAGARVVDFDDVAAPTGFSASLALREQYAAVGVTFQGAAVKDGGAILNQASNFDVFGFSPPNFLAFNTPGTLQDGGHAVFPQSLLFRHPVRSVQINVGDTAGHSFTIEAFNEDGVSLGTNSIIAGSNMQTLQIERRRIAKVVLTSSGVVGIFDDLAFVLDTTLIDFDDVVGAPGTFANASALRNRYAAKGVTFASLETLDGGAVLDQSAGFLVTGFSPPNYLAFSSLGTLSTGGKPQLPQYLLFNPPVKHVEFKVADFGASKVSIQANDSNGDYLAAAGLFTGSDMRTIGVSSPGISTLIITSNGSTAVIDDLEFDVDGTLIDFDDVSNPPNSFDEATALRDRYEALGVWFSGPGKNGAAILNQSSNFGVTGHSSPNFLAVSNLSMLADGGLAQLPETLYFDPPAKRVEMRVGGNFLGRIMIEGFDATEQSVATNYVDSTSAMQTLNLYFEGIQKLVVTSNGSSGVIDDLAFAPVDPCVHNMCYVGSELNRYCDPCVTLVCAEDSDCCNEAWTLQCALAISNVCKVYCEPLCGDANDDRRVTAPDALAALKTAVGSATCPLHRCDFNGDTKVLAGDSLAILKRAIGLVTTPNCPNEPV